MNSYYFSQQAASLQTNKVSNQTPNQKAKEKRKWGRRETQSHLDLRNSYLPNTSKGFHRKNM